MGHHLAVLPNKLETRLGFMPQILKKPVYAFDCNKVGHIPDHNILDATRIECLFELPAYALIDVIILKINDQRLYLAEAMDQSDDCLVLCERIFRVKTRAIAGSRSEGVQTTYTQHHSKTCNVAER